LQRGKPVCLYFKFILQKTAHQMGNVLPKKRESRYPPKSQTETRPTQLLTNIPAHPMGNAVPQQQQSRQQPALSQPELKPTQTTTNDPPRIKLDNTDEFDAQRRSANDWIKKKHVELMDLDTDKGTNTEKARRLR
uniref:PRP21_like_P domain-containing protein n=1 Tax=Macrostomum lignano TaxID=282301 RepID=A0A1I8GID6_9PLAT